MMLPIPTVLLIAFAGSLAGCAVHARRAGLVEAGEGPVLLRERGGRETVLVASGEAAPVRFLDGCVVLVAGPRVGKRLWVRTWEVADAGDGSRPYVGRLRRFGGNWIVDDRTTGHELVLDFASVGELGEHDGRMVMVIGYVVGVQTVRVVAWRVLE